MDDYPIYLCDKLNNWVKQIILKFTYINYITVDFWDYFPLLKQGKCYRSTFSYLVKICEILCTDKSSNKSRYELLVDNVGFNPMNYRAFKENIVNELNEKITQELYIERLHIYELQSCFAFMVGNQNNFIIENGSYNQLCQLLISFESIHIIMGTDRFNENGKYESLLKKLLSNQIIRLIGYVLQCDELNVNLCLNTIDPRVYNNVLYLLSIDQNIDMIELINNRRTKEQTSLVVKNNISNMIRDVSIKRNWLDKQVLINCFESLIGSSEIPNNIFVHMNKLR